MAQDLIKLSEDQKKLSLKLVGEGLPIGDITKIVFSNESLDGRCIEGKSVKAFLVSNGGKPKTAKFEKTTKDVLLSEAQKEIIASNIGGVTNTVEMTRLVFKIPHTQKVEPLGKQFKSVFAYMKSISEGKNTNDEPVEEILYRPPAAIQHVIGKANSYVTNRGSGTRKKIYDWNNLTRDDTKNLEALVGYMNIQRFVYQASQYTKRIDRILYESNFIRYVHNKPDLTEEEVDQYIALCEEVVLAVSASRRKIKLEQLVEDITEGEEKKVVSMSIVELINSLKKEIEDSKKRQEKLINVLAGTRRDRIKGQVDRNASIINLVEAWQNEEKRLQIIELGIKEHSSDEKEIDRLSNLDAVVALIAAITKGEARN